MLELSNHEWELINQITSEFHGTKDYTQARRKFLQSLKKLVDFDLGDYCLTTSKNRTSPLLRDPVVVSRFSKEFEEVFTLKYESHYGELDYTRWFYANEESVVYRESDIIQNEIRQKTAYYQDYLKPHDLIHVAGISISSKGLSYGVVTLYRKSQKSDFSDHDLFVLEKFLPHLKSRMQLEYQTQVEIAPEENFLSYLIRNYQITKREAQILLSVLSGNSNQEIASSLSITENTVKKHMGHLLTKLQVKNRVQLIHKLLEEEGESILQKGFSGKRI